MISAPDRRSTLSLIEEARGAGARLSAVSAELGLSARTVQRWTGPDGSVREDARPTAVRPAPANRLSEAERDRIVATCNASGFASRSALCPVHWTGQSGFA
jgi:AraC-like DNA-binding protein